MIAVCLLAFAIICAVALPPRWNQIGAIALSLLAILATALHY